MRTFALALALVLISPALAHAKQYRFAGMHPVAKQQGGGYCYIQGPHVHVYAPQQADVLYRDEGDWNRFVGDPVAYGYDGPRFIFHGAHPIQVGPVTHYCYLRGDHFHEYQPEESPEFEVRAGVHFYMGEFPKPFYDARPRLSKINVVYQPIRYARPVVTVEAPPEYVDVLYVDTAPARAVYVEPAPVRAEAHWGIGVHVDVPPPPSLEVHIGTPGVVVEERTVIHEVHVKHKKYKHGRGHWRRW